METGRSVRPATLMSWSAASLCSGAHGRGAHGRGAYPHRGEPLRNVRRPPRAWSLLAVLGSGRIYFFAAAAAGAVPT